MRSRPRLLLALALSIAGCVRHGAPRIKGGEGGGPAEPATGPDAPATSGHARFHVWSSDGVWHVRAIPVGKPHRFQGSVEGLGGVVSDLHLTDESLHDNTSVAGDTVQFDFEASEEKGFDATVAGGCANFDLYVDGKRRADRVQVDGKKAPQRVPFERCPE